jgi:hypothetical protein
MKKKLILIKKEKNITFQYIGFNSRNEYGELFVTVNDSTTIYRGEGIDKVTRQAKIGSGILQEKR